ncbi:hypothetical protein SELMODRAFT_232728 [Selaginella moellendorffii]|uniref:Peroxidase n=2 Tax=Selaginella moellendorffii TaxID=88036 RepID=D8RYY2_SELML|nr:hypothetical protein SELMODRAFT_235209 [Selaginella moellendorffii]EFJ22514.1 hypothetical protein SELMODRAFT_232728 [Selaginella moellendorffii]
MGYYKCTRKCVNAEAIVKKIVRQYVKRDPTLAASLLRMHFHDCFVMGCDASILLNSTKTSIAERDALPNLSLRGFEVINAAKAALEAACPKTVSCADILSLAARDSVETIYGPSWDVPTGRRDGIISNASDVLLNLPPFFANFTTLKSIFAAKGLNVIDLVALSGGHTIGFSHCAAFDARLYNFTGKGDADPSLDPAYAAHLRTKCKHGDLVTKVPLDDTLTGFDTNYYKFIMQNKGLLQSDAALLETRRSRFLVEQSTKPSIFRPQFARSMTKMGRIEVLVEKQGQIRSRCEFVN